MNIYANRGAKVRFLDQNGTDYDLEKAREYFKKDQILTVRSTDVGGWRTEIMFQECVGEWFNSVMFEDVENV